MFGTRSWRIVSGLFLLTSAACSNEPIEISEETDAWPSRVLITNDDGIESRATLELAAAFAGLAETYLIAPEVNQSSSTNFASAAQTGRFVVEQRDVGSGITAWAMDGYPADCVFFALAGPMRDSPPDLVISGVNTGANLSDAWIGSGTVGAARVAAYYGVPAIAVSGVDNDDAEAVEAVVAWVVKFARSQAVRQLRAPQFLTVSLPVGPPSEIVGIEVTERARGLRDFTTLQLTAEADAQGWQTWSFDVVRDAFPAQANTDAIVAGEGKIAIVAMRVDETDPELHRWLTQNKALIPVW